MGGRWLQNPVVLAKVGGAGLPAPGRPLVRRLRRSWGRLVALVDTSTHRPGGLCAAILTSWELQFAAPPANQGHVRMLGIMEPGTDSVLHAMATRRRCLIRGTTELLQSLGATCGGVAASLFEAGARGEPGDPQRAPLAAYLSSVVGADPGVKSVSVGTAGLTITRRCRWHRKIRVTFPPSVVTFVAGFEAGFYSELVRRH